MILISSYLEFTIKMSKSNVQRHKKCGKRVYSLVYIVVYCVNMIRLALNTMHD